MGEAVQKAVKNKHATNTNRPSSEFIACLNSIREDGENYNGTYAGATEVTNNLVFNRLDGVNIL